MILRAVVIAAIIVAVLLLFAATKPATLKLQRSTVINTLPEKVFALIYDLHHWKDWQPQDEEDSTLTRTFSGPASGVGAASEWDSRGKAGKGRMLITESQAPNRIAVKVDFVKPFESHNLNEFTLEPDPASTKVTWSWQGQNLCFMKVMGIFGSMDRMIGKHFDDGLAGLKTYAEK
ncbi:MAG TPA: SRPBCC family protein [Candidatus Sulfotelmatobacter sp.]|nr:SRPBCC family protein [Candidatus Sulfotelmatobacter sp.]